MTYSLMTVRQAKENGWGPLQLAAYRCAARTANWLMRELEKFDDEAGGDDEADDDNPYRSGGEMKFLPGHQGGGFTGDFTEDNWLVPLDFCVTEETDPTVMNAVKRAFLAGVRWQQRRERKNNKGELS